MGTTRTTIAVTKARPRTKKPDYADQYRAGVRSAVYGLWRGEFDFFQFVDAMVSAIDRNFTTAWYDGMASCGMTPAEITQEERDRLQLEINTEIQYLMKYASAITEGSKANRGKLRDFTGRIPMWVNRFEGIRELAKIYACGDKKFEWVIGRTKEHCKDCLMLSGRVYRGSVWKASGWEPRSRDLECGGYKCLCRFVETSAPATPGVPPRKF